MKRMTMLVLALGLVFGLTSFARAEGTDNNFVLINDTGYTIDQVFVSPADAKTWEEDIMGEGVLKNGDQVGITFSPKADADKYDLKVIYDDKSEAIWTALDLTQINSLTLKYDKAQDVTSVVIDAPAAPAPAPAPAATGSDNDFVLVNDTGYTIDQVFVSAANAQTWEEDIMGEGVLKNGDQVKISFHPKAATENYDLKVIYDDKTEAVWTGLDLTEINKLTLKYDKAANVTSVVAE